VTGRPPKQNLLGQRFGMLLVLKSAGRDKKSNALWECRCDCGNIKTFQGSKLIMKNNPTKSCGCSRILPSGQGAFNKLFYTYSYDAKRRGFAFDLTKDDFKNITKQPCFYCGENPSKVFGAKGNNGTYTYTGVDRIDSNKGYIKGNVIPCCSFCNTMKMNLNYNEFLFRIKKIYLKLMHGGWE
jgi:hypothetical protein